MTDLDQRRRRALYRASHRGTKEMDWLLGRFVEAGIAHMSEPELTELEQLLALPDPHLQAWLMSGTSDGGNDLGPLVERIRAFHGLESASRGAAP